METIQYSEVFKQALIMTWKNKFTWFFGLLIFLGSIVSNVNLNLGSISRQSERYQATRELIQNHLLISFIVGFISIILLITFFLLKFIASAALIKSANNITVYRQSKIKAIFHEAKKYLWTLLLLEIMTYLTVFIIVLILFIPVIYLLMLKASIFATYSFIIASLIIISVAIIIYYLRRYAYFYVILGNMKLRLALENAYCLLRKNVRESLIMGLLAIAFGLAAFITISVLISIIAIIILPLVLAAFLIFTKAGALTVLAIGSIVEIIVFALLFSIYLSFSQILWTLFFREISLEKREKKLAALKLETETKIPTPEAV